MPRRSKRIAEKKYNSSEQWDYAGPSNRPSLPSSPPAPAQPPLPSPAPAPLPSSPPASLEQPFSSGAQIGRFKHFKFVLKELRPKRKIKNFGTKLFCFKLEQVQQGEQKPEILDDQSLDWLYSSLEKSLKLLRTKFDPKDDPKVQLTITFQNLGQRFISVQAQKLFSRTAKSSLVDWMVRMGQTA